MANALCPDCGQQVEVGPTPKLGQWLTCAHCSAELEVVSVNPVELDWASELEDDEDDEFWDEEEVWAEDDEDWDDEDL
jgi:alpha-aminoadipate/glutamate carrier protein LysW